MTVIGILLTKNYIVRWGKKMCAIGYAGAGITLILIYLFPATNLIFGISYLAAIIPLAFYPLNAGKNAQIQASLDAKRAAIKAGPFVRQAMYRLFNDG